MESERRRQERLCYRRELYQLRMASKSPQEREARLARQCNYMHRRRANERQRQQLQVQTEAQLCNHTTAENSQDVFPSFDDPTVIAKLAEFHQHMLSLESAKCSVCQEKSPSVHVDNTSICT